MEKSTPILIIGAGLSGLTLAYRLHQRQQPFLLLEARDRPGGRILTARPEGEAPLELGATWLGKKHDRLVALLAELDLPVFEQVTGGRAIYEAISTSPPQVVQLPHNDEPSFRIAGGSDTLIEALLAKIPGDRIHYGTAVEAIQLQGESVVLTTTKGTFRADKVVSTLPPHLLLARVDIYPELPGQLRTLAASTHTWMGESIKVGLRYRKPFWKGDGPGGTIFSNVGPVSEMYDHSNVEDDRFALKGFLNGTYFSLSREERREMVLGQLRKYYGTAVDDYLSYEEAVWREEPYTFVPYAGHVLPHQHNGHPLFRETYLEGRLLLAGSETAVIYPGYMDGAVRSAERAAETLVPTANR
ncbi:MAG: NAD(P)/FAD-dependent oxidoreductase [Bacteroidota bacterium]